jgi:hypothetical protein
VAAAQNKKSEIVRGPESPPKVDLAAGRSKVRHGGSRLRKRQRLRAFGESLHDVLLSPNHSSFSNFQLHIHQFSIPHSAFKFVICPRRAFALRM